LSVRASPSRASPRRQCLCRQCSFEHAARALPRVQRRPPTLLALELEEPFPFRPTADVLCRLVGTSRDGSNHHPSCRTAAAWLETRFSPAALQPLDRLGPDCADAPRVRRSAALSPERLESYRSPPRILGQPSSLGLTNLSETRALHTRSPDYLREVPSRTPRRPPS
jgi:hypothetical protein